MKSKSKFFLGIILVAFIVILGVYLDKQPLPDSKQPTTTDNDNKSQTTENIGGGYLSGSVVFLSLNTEANNIYAIDPTDKTKKIVFTDKDESLKIKQCQSVTFDGKKILATLADKNEQFLSSLWFINTDGKGEKKELTQNFASPTAPIISPDAKKIAYTVFSNVEANYGFSLIVANSDNSNKQTLAQDTSSIANFAFSPDSAYIFYAKGTELGKAGLFKTKIASGDSQNIYSLKAKEAIYSTTVGKDNLVAISLGPIGNNMLNKSEIYLMDNNGKNMRKITENNAHENFLSFSSDGKRLAYLSIKYEDDAKKANIPGEIYVSASDGKNPQSLGQEADNIIGWLP